VGAVGFGAQGVNHTNDGGAMPNAGVVLGILLDEVHHFLVFLDVSHGAFGHA
jgi:hypothetical protein